MKLHYYDERTPANYEPPLFRAGTGQDSLYHFSMEPTKMKLGRVEMDHHSYAINLASFP